MLVEKKHHPEENSEINVCIDYRGLNAITKTDFFPLPQLQATIDQLLGAKFFTTVDLATGYFQVELDERECEKTAFSTSFGNNEFFENANGTKK